MLNILRTIIFHPYPWRLLNLAKTRQWRWNHVLRNGQPEKEGLDTIWLQRSGNQIGKSDTSIVSEASSRRLWKALSGFCHDSKNLLLHFHRAPALWATFMFFHSRTSNSKLPRRQRNHPSELEHPTPWYMMTNLQKSGGEVKMLQNKIKWFVKYIKALKVTLRYGE